MKNQMKPQWTMIAAGLMLATTASIANAQVPVPTPAPAAAAAPVKPAPAVKRHPSMLTCAANIARERKNYDVSVKQHMADGKIDATEKAGLDKTHEELMALEKKANEDGKMTPEECKGIHAKIVEENRKLAAAIGVRPKDHINRKVVRHPAVILCAADIARERAHFEGAVKKGVADGKIDATEKAGLDKTHDELMVLEKKANEDGKMTPEECKGIHAKIVEQHRKLIAALEVKKVLPPTK